jgi:hypothetical protein
LSLRILRATSSAAAYGASVLAADAAAGGRSVRRRVREVELLSYGEKLTKRSLEPFAA